MKMSCHHCAKLMFNGQDKSNLIGGAWYKDKNDLNHLILMCKSCKTAHDCTGTSNLFSLVSGNPLKCRGIIKFEEIKNAIASDKFDELNFPKIICEYLEGEGIYRKSAIQKETKSETDNLRAMVHLACSHTKEINKALDQNFHESDSSAIYFSSFMCWAAIKQAFSNENIHWGIVKSVRDELDKIFNTISNYDVLTTAKIDADNELQKSDELSHDNMVEILTRKYIDLRKINNAEINNIEFNKIGRVVHLMLLLCVNCLDSEIASQYLIKKELEKAKRNNGSLSEVEQDIWIMLAEYNPDIKSALKKITPYGKKYIDLFSYQVMNQKKGMELDVITQSIIIEAQNDLGRMEL